MVSPLNSVSTPAKIRKREGFKEGQQFSFLKTEEGYVLIPLLTETQLQEDLISSELLIKSMKEAHTSDIELER